ncbi:unnamed protein product [Pieris macdunnoughi]|uniref:DDB1- and CUL4-associated factor 12 beta-propeller domain-containing protein n=1 Tax=Pieris macdunnoughi TaxID=345717 RepID=A0A821QKZ3_9NEOP|nr:unnamed protein product [Pieris macdunnoughi]
MSQTVRRSKVSILLYTKRQAEYMKDEARTWALRPENQDFVRYSDSDSEEETPTEQHITLCTSYNFVDYVRSREIQAPEEVRAFNPRWREIAALSLDGYIHVFDASTFRQTLSQKLPSRQDLFCLATQESGSLYAIGCKSYTLLLDSRTLKSVKKITSRNNVCGIRSATFRGDLLTISTEVGLLMFYDVRAGKYLKSNLHPTKTVALRAWRVCAPGRRSGRTPTSEYTHCYDDSGTTIFTAGGPSPAALIGNYAGIWQ